MQNLLSEAPSDFNSLGVIAYLIIANNQIHRYQLLIVNEYLNSIKVNLNETIIPKILDGNINEFSFSDSLDSLHRESANVQKTICFVMVAAAYADNALDEKENKVINSVFRQTSLSKTEKDEIKANAVFFTIVFISFTQKNHLVRYLNEKKDFLNPSFLKSCITY